MCNMKRVKEDTHLPLPIKKLKRDELLHYALPLLVTNETRGPGEKKERQGPLSSSHFSSRYETCTGTNVSIYCQFNSIDLIFRGV
jgi:hypothetical protein